MTERIIQVNVNNIDNLIIDNVDNIDKINIMILN